MFKCIERWGIKDGFNSSHAISTAYDSVYGAYLKANYPLEYFTVILNKYENKTDMTSKIYKELPSFNISVSSIKFRKSRARYSADKENNQVVKGLKSIKFLNEKIADELYELKDNEYSNFVDVLVDIKEKTSVNSRQFKTLIMLNFFEEFGKNKKLLSTYEYFNNRYKKTHKEDTKIKRINEILEYEKSLKDEKFDIAEQIIFEKESLGYGQTFSDKVDNNISVILDIDTKYTPRLTLYSLKTGKEAQIKVSKKHFYTEGIANLEKGNVVKINKINRKPRKKLIEGKWQETDQTDFWMDSWQIINE